LRLLLVRKTGEGKSAVFYATALLNGGVIIVFYPLKSLAINQVSGTVLWQQQQQPTTEKEAAALAPHHRLLGTNNG
jgi:hypothetical protein